MRNSELVSGAGASLDSLFRTIEATLRPNALEIPGRSVQFDVAFDIRAVRTQNVVGILPGTDSMLSKECIVIGGHYDHVGLGHRASMSKKFEGAVHHGADDNASGVGMMLELAEKFTTIKGSHKRSIICIAFTGEEKGMLGSRHYVENPVIDLSKVNLTINLDMVGRLRETKTIQKSGVGTAEVDQT